MNVASRLVKGEFSYGKLSFEEVRRFLMETDQEFLTPLSTHINIDAYAKKLSLYSDFSICRDDKSIVGMISCYTNQPPMGYISNVCVKKQYQDQRVFSRLYRTLLHQVELRGISIIRLEVDSRNEKAQSVYRHFGFNSLETDAVSGKILMEVIVR